MKHSYSKSPDGKWSVEIGPITAADEVTPLHLAVSDLAAKNPGRICFGAESNQQPGKVFVQVLGDDDTHTVEV